MKKVVSKFTRMARVALVASIGLGSGLTALASQEVAVGRVDVQLPGDGWQVYLMDENANTISTSGHTHQQLTEFKLIARGDADRVLQALFLVRANRTGKGRFAGVMYPNMACKAAQHVYAEGDEPSAGARSFRCMQVVAPHRVAEAKTIPPHVMEVLAREGWTLPPVMVSAYSAQYATTGAFAMVMAFVQPTQEGGVEGASIELPQALPAGVTAQSVWWGRQLQKAVSDSVYSIRGKLPVPDLERVGGIR